MARETHVETPVKLATPSRSEIERGASDFIWQLGLALQNSGTLPKHLVDTVFHPNSLTKGDGNMDIRGTHIARFTYSLTPTGATYTLHQSPSSVMRSIFQKPEEVTITMQRKDGLVTPEGAHITYSATNQWTTETDSHIDNRIALEQARKFPRKIFQI